MPWFSNGLCSNSSWTFLIKNTKMHSVIVSEQQNQSSKVKYVEMQQLNQYLLYSFASFTDRHHSACTRRIFYFTRSRLLFFPYLSTILYLLKIKSHDVKGCRNDNFSSCKLLVYPGLIRDISSLSRFSIYYYTDSSTI